MMNSGIPAIRSSGPIDVVVVGASGDLARRKIFPALFSLDSQNLLPEAIRFYGFARSDWTDEAFRNHLAENLTCRYVADPASCADKMDGFLKRCFYVSGAYDSSEAFLDLYRAMAARNPDGNAKSLLYMAIPPFLFLDVARAIGDAGLIGCDDSPAGWTRVVIEKPFGRDRASSDELVAAMGGIITEDQTYRIDHYLGKEIIQNLIVLRFANRIFEPLWNRMHIESVQICFRENIGIEGRTGYFDQYGIIRDIMQNHLLQILALVAMERPHRLDAGDIGDEKVRALRCIPPLRAGDFVLGQYHGYLDHDGVPADSITPTYARTTLRIDNDRWEGIPFVMSAGKSLDRRMTEIRIRFRPVANGLFESSNADVAANDLVLRVQPDAAINLNITNKMPGLEMELSQRNLNLNYDAAYATVMPEAYETLLLDVIQGDKSLFIRKDELEAAWDIFTPALHEMEELRGAPQSYPPGSSDLGEDVSISRHVSKDAETHAPET